MARRARYPWPVTAATVLAPCACGSTRTCAPATVCASTTAPTCSPSSRTASPTSPRPAGRSTTRAARARWPGCRSRQVQQRHPRRRGLPGRVHLHRDRPAGRRRPRRRGRRPHRRPRRAPLRRRLNADPSASVHRSASCATPRTNTRVSASAPRAAAAAWNCYYGGSANPLELPMTSFDLDLTKYQLGWSDEVEYAFAPEKGINDRRRRADLLVEGRAAVDDATCACAACALFDRKPMAQWFAVNMPDIDFQDIYYYLRPSGEQVDEWDDLPEQMKATYEKLGIPEAERKYLAGVTAQYESEVVYHRNREDLGQAGDPVLRHGHRAARVPRPGQAVLRHGHPARRQQVRRPQHVGVVRRLVHLRAAGRQRARCRCRPTSGSTPRTPASSSAR